MLTILKISNQQLQFFFINFGKNLGKFLQAKYVENYFLSIFGKNVRKFHSFLKVRGLFPQKLTTDHKSYFYRLNMLKISTQQLQNCNFEKYWTLYFNNFW